MVSCRGTRGLRCASASRDLNRRNVSLTLFTVNEPWLYSVLWCSDVSSVSSEAPHVLKKVPYPLWLLVRTTATAAGWGLVPQSMYFLPRPYVSYLLLPFLCL